jgi:hypothetical protein
LKPLPRLDLAAAHFSPFDEAMIVIDGREEETITIECPNAAYLAERIVGLVNAARRLQGAPPSDETQAPYRAIDC